MEEILPLKLDSRNVNQDIDGNFDETEQFHEKSFLKIGLHDSSQPEDDPSLQDQDAPHEIGLLSGEVFSEDNKDNLINPEALLVAVGSDKSLIKSGRDMQESKNQTTLPKKTGLPGLNPEIENGNTSKIFTMNLYYGLKKNEPFFKRSVVGDRTTRKAAKASQGFYDAMFAIRSTNKYPDKPNYPKKVVYHLEDKASMNN